MTENRLRQIALDALTTLVDDQPTIANVGATAVMLFTCGAALGTLGTDASGFGPAVAAFLATIGGNVFSSALEKLRQRRDQGAQLTPDDLRELRELVAQTNLDAELQKSDFQQEMRTLFARLDLFTDAIQQATRDGVGVIITALDMNYGLLTERIVRDMADVKIQYADIQQKLEKLREEVSTAQGKRTLLRPAVPPMGHVFISYARQDGETFARKLHDELEKDDIDAWLDRYDIKPGEEWDAAIQSAIEDCKLFVFVLTPAGATSFNCKNEWTHALSTKKTITIVMLEGDDSLIPMRLNTLQYIDFRASEKFKFRLADLRRAYINLDQPLPSEQIARQQKSAEILAEAQAQSHSKQPKFTTRLINPLPLDIHERFKDRVQEQAQLNNLLVSNVRLVSIYGRGGTGKTALACKVLDDLQRSKDAPTGIVCLQETRHDATDTGINVDRIFRDFTKLMMPEVRSELESIWRESSVRLGEKISKLLQALSSGRYVLLLDNLETYQDDSGTLTNTELVQFFEVALKQARGLTLLVTSQEPLNLPYELKIEERIVLLDKGLPIKDAVDLLRELDPDKAAGLRDASEEKLRVIAERTLGYPRALEAIAGLLLEDPLLSLDMLLTNPVLLSSEVTTVIVQQAIARLSPEAVRVMEGIALYSRPIKQSALEFLLAPYIETAKLSKILRRLVRAHFATFNKLTSTYVLHPTDSEFCLNRIPEGELGDIDKYTRYGLHKRAADYYQRTRKPKSDWKAIDDLAPQLAEFDFRVNAGDYNSAAELLLSITFDYLILWGHNTLVTVMLEQPLRYLTDRNLEAGCLVALGTCYFFLGQYERSIEYHQHALKISHEISNRQGEGAALGNLGSCYQALSQYKRAIEYFQKALEIAYEIGAPRDIGNGLGNLGHCYHDLGRNELAIEYYQKTLVISRERGDHRNESVTLDNLGLCYRDLGLNERSIEYHQYALEICRENGDRQGISAGLGNLGNCYQFLGQHGRAIEYYQQALEISREINDRRSESIAWGNLGTVYHNLGQCERAIECHQHALDISDKISDRQGISRHMSNLGACYRDLGQYQRAIECSKKGLSLANEIGDRFHEGSYLANLGFVLFMVERSIGTAQHLQQGIDILQETKNAYGLPLVEIDLSNVFLTLDLLEKANDAIKSAREHDNLLCKSKTAVLHGVVLQRQGEHPAAQTAFDNATNYADELLSLTPQLWDHHYTRGIAHAGLILHGGDPQLAVDDFKTARSIFAGDGAIKEQLMLFDALMKADDGEVLAPIRAVLAGES